MKAYIATLQSTSTIQFSKHVQVPKLEKESDDDYDKRIWREKAHFNKEGYVIIPDTFFKNSLAEVAKYLSIQIKGKGKATYTKHFEAGLIVEAPLVTSVKKEDLEYCDVFGSSTGQRGSGRRVLKRFPILYEWEGDVEYLILDETITFDIFEQFLIACGQFQGLGTWRPRNGGLYGRFKVIRIKEM